MTAPELLKAQMPLIHQCESNVVAYGYTKGTREYTRAFNVELSFYRKFVILPEISEPYKIL